MQQGLATTQQAFADAFFQISNDQRTSPLDNLEACTKKEVAATSNNAAQKANIEAAYVIRELEVKLR